MSGHPHNSAHELRRGMDAARLELPAPVWDDLNARVEAVLKESEQMRAILAGAHLRPDQIYNAETKRWEPA